MENIVLEIQEKVDERPDTSNDAALARALYDQERAYNNQMLAQSREQSIATRSNVERRQRYNNNRFKMQFSR